ncbi:hypothetical protein [Clostridium sp. AN503]|uniref:hypothetical protein n=1 Tax=Clostridium sp. AN503 TaxID=3160598 RepID=UPI0034573C35
MNTFFDLREFFIVILRKAKLCIVLTSLCVLGGCMIRFVPLIIEYVTFQEPSIESTQQLAEDFPYKYQARRTLFLDSKYENIEGLVVDQTPTIANAYLACYQNKEVLQPLVDKYYTDAAKDFIQYNEKLVEYNYNTKAILEEVYTPAKFYDVVSIKVVGSTEEKIGNYINIYATTGSRDLSEDIVTDAEKLLSSYVQNLVGEYHYTITEGQLGEIMPQASAGLIPKSLSGSSSQVATRLELSYILKRSIKGAIWGLGGGIGLSVILCFFFHCLSLNITTEEDLKGYSVPVLASVKIKGKKHFLGFVDDWIDILEGNNQNCSSYEEAGKLVSAYLHAMESVSTGHIVVTGAGNVRELERFGEELHKAEPEYSISMSDSITTSSDTVEKISNALGAILFESLGYSNKQEIQKEITRIEQLGKKVYGIVLEK